MPFLTLEPSGQTFTIQVVTRPPVTQGTSTGLTEACVDPPPDTVEQGSETTPEDHEEDMPHEDQDNDPHVRLRLQAQAQRDAPDYLTPEAVQDIEAPILESDPALPVAPEDQVPYDPLRARYDWRKPVEETGPESPSSTSVPSSGPALISRSYCRGGDPRTRRGSLGA